MPDRRVVRTPNGEIYSEITDNGQALKLTISRGNHWMSIFLGPSKVDRFASILDEQVTAIQEGDVEIGEDERALP